MAEEEIVILEADDGISELESQDEERQDETIEASDNQDKKKRKILLIIIAIITLLLLLLVATFLIFNQSQTKKVANIDTHKIAQKLIKKENSSQFSPSRIESMIQKANILYETGEKHKALKIYEKISNFNEALSFYNMGVVKMKEKNYKEAIQAFKKAIQNREQKCISAINAAISALHLGDQKLFTYYLDLASAYLPEDANAPIYSYEMSLINYYRNFYYEALSTLKHPNSKFYHYEQKYLTSKIFAYFHHDKDAIDALLSSNSPHNNLPLGLLYARNGEYKIAQRYLKKAQQHTNDPIRVQMARALVENKLGELKTAADLMNDSLKLNKNKTLSTYAIHVTLRESLFDVNLAQKDFEKQLFANQESTYALIFYFAPYKIFNASQGIEYTRKGSMNIYLDKLSSAQTYLKASSTLSRINLSISKGIKEALSNHIFKANQTFKSLIKSYPEHAILHYDLALTYAQIGNYTLAYRHFSTSYHLDNTNYLAGIFAIYCSNLIKKNATKLTDDVKSSIALDHTLKDVNRYMSLISLSQNNKFAMSRWLEESKKTDPLNLIFDIIIAHKVSNANLFRQNVQALQALLPKDLMSNIIFFHMKNSHKPIKEYAKAFQIRFKNNHLNLNSFYYGPSIAREQFTKLLQISGLLFYERDALKAKIPLETYDRQALIYTLAYLDIFTHNFEESYVLYNKLIDDYNQKDSKTIFLAAVAAIGAGHTANAIALLELSKLIDPENFESRYALGLLYQEVNNFAGASIQYIKIGDSGFTSKYFSFKIKNN
ncbi:tetratricopeptide repeat protein [Sulfurospirillum sp. 1612]|uniref:tetratricopeptide repeat protein n=1 Tax=Sulfurospirillum sp. 1612 TaxID=3094835 RepID=UPI002F94BE51